MPFHKVVILKHFHRLSPFLDCFFFERFKAVVFILTASWEEITCKSSCWGKPKHIKRIPPFQAESLNISIKWPSPIVGRWQRPQLSLLSREHGPAYLSVHVHMSPPSGEEVIPDTSVPPIEKHKERTHDGHNTVAPSPTTDGVADDSVLTDRLRNHRGFVKYFRQTPTFYARALPKKQAFLLNRAAANAGANCDTAMKAEKERLPQSPIIRQLVLHGNKYV